MDKTSIFKDKLGRNIFRVTNVHNCNVEIKFICKEYIFEFCNVYISETGLVKIFTIKNKSKK